MTDDVINEAVDDEAPPLDPRRRRFAEIEAALERVEAAPAAGERERVRDDIVALFRETEAALAELTGFKESIRALVQRYKSLPASTPDAATVDSPAFRPPRVDHLGSSTYAERAWSALAECRYDAAIREAERALELAPDNEYAATLLGWAQAGTDAWDDARKTLEGVLRREPDHALALACLGYVALRQGHLDEADEHLARGLREDSDRKAHLYAHLFRGMTLTERKMYPEARVALARALELGPNLIEAQWQMGRSHYIEGDPALAAEAWRKGLETNGFNIWGERCGKAAECVTAGHPVPLD